MNEADFKKLFCDNVKAQGGYTLRLATSSIIGLPDIYCQMSRRAPILLEAKFMKINNGDTFRRRIQYRALQQHTLRQCWKINPYTAFCLIGVERHKELYWDLIEPHLNEYNDMLFAQAKKIENKILNIEQMFFSHCVPTI